MELTIKSGFLVSFIVLLNCLCYGCGSKKDTVAKDVVSYENITEQIQKEQEEAERFNQILSAVEPEDTPIVHNYTLCAMDDGKVSSISQYEKKMDPEDALNEVYEKMLTELGTYLEYELKFHQVVVNKEKVQIDWEESCDLFHKEKFKKNTNGVVTYTDYDDMVFGILDSVNQTIKENHGENVKVYYTENGKELSLPELSFATAFLAQEEYFGSAYYKDLSMSRAEGNMSLIAQLGMSSSEVILQLVKNGIESEQREEFSMLGDHTGWENYHDYDEYLKQAWIKIILSTDEYQYGFDGKDQRLMDITVCTQRIPSSRGLYIGDPVEQMVQLYGEEYTMYVTEDGLLYEYQLEDCYFRVVMDEAQEQVIRFGIASYSYAEVVHGQQIIEKIHHQQELDEAISKGEITGI